MNSQKGMATLLVTSMLLVVSLLFSLASYKNAFYQIKRTQNEVLARQAHWLAEGGLECGFALVNVLKDVNLVKTELVSKCKLPLNLEAINISGSGPYVLASRATVNTANKSITKKFTTAGNGSSGALKSSSDIYFHGSYSISPDPGMKASVNEWQCTMLRYKGTIGVYGHLMNQGLIANKPPYSGFPLAGQSCASKYQSTLGAGSWSGTLPDMLDIVYDPDLDPFKDVFNVPRQNWKKIRDNENFKLLPGTLVTTKTENVIYKKLLGCGEGIASAIVQGYDLVWVDGTCELNDSAFKVIDQAIAGSSEIDGIILVVQDGILSVRGAHKFPGMIYHFNTVFLPHEAMWKDMESHINFPITSSVPLAKASYYQSGAFMPSGGYVMDAPGQFAVFGSAMNFLYNRDLIEKPLNKLKKTSWLEGSWYDF